MILNYIKAALKIIKRHSGFTTLNVIGLVLGISSCLLIILYVNFELGFDKFHINKNDIYRVVMRQPGNQVRGSTSDWWIVSPYILKPTWERELPEVKLACRIADRNWSFKDNDQYISENILIVDPEFFDLFTFPLISGNKKEVLNNPYSIVISPRMADKYFGEINPVGKTFVTNEGIVFSVTGVLKEIPENSHLKFDFLVSFQTLESINGQSLISQNWLNNSYRTYLLLDRNTNLQEFDSKLRKYDVDGFNGKKWSFHLQPLSDIHFNQQIRGTGSKETLFIFITAGVFILFIAGFNFVNLYIAHYRSRTKNIGIRRFLGANRIQLTLQFLSESSLIVFLSTLVSVVTVWLILPLFNDFIGEHLIFKSLSDYNVLISSLCVVVLLAFITGIYPAMYLSGFNLIEGIKGGIAKFSKNAMTFRKVIMVVQFSVSIILLIGTITIYKQLKYVANKPLGYNKEHILYMSLNDIRYDSTRKNRIQTLRQELLKNPDIITVAGSSGVPSKIGWSNIPVWEGKEEGNNPFFYRLSVDADFLDLYGIKVIQGRGFSANMPGDIGNSYILNEAAVQSLDLKSPVGYRFGFDKKLGTVVGVVKNFNFESLHKPVTPLGIGFNGGDQFQFLSLKINNKNLPLTITYIEKIWSKISNNVALKYSFIDDQVNQLYNKDNRLAESLNYFSFMALFICCIGIFGLMSISIKEKTKEIGIRKVNGAPVPDLAILMLKDNFVIIFFATVVGGILGWYVAGHWLKNFAYRIDFGFDIILLASLISLLMAIIPVSFKLWRAIRTNPVESLRTD
jgi:putative ABC transport system permease protein